METPRHPLGRRPGSAANPDMVRLIGARMRPPGRQADGPSQGLTNQLAARADHDTADRLGCHHAARRSCAAAASTASPHRPTANSWPRAIPGRPARDVRRRPRRSSCRTPPRIPAIVAFLADATRPSRDRAVDCLAWISTATPEWKALGGALRRDLDATPARTLRRRARAGGAHDGRGSRPRPRLLEATGHGRDRASPDGPGASGQGRRAPRRHVRGRAHQHDRGPRRAARGPAHAAGQPRSTSTARTSSATCRPC